MDAVLLQQTLNGSIQKFESLICLQRHWPIFVNVLFSAATNDAADLFFSGTHQATFVKTSITVRRKVIPSLLFFKFDRSTRSALSPFSDRSRPSSVLYFTLPLKDIRWVGGGDVVSTARFLASDQEYADVHQNRHYHAYNDGDGPTV